MFEVLLDREGQGDDDKQPHEQADQLSHVGRLIGGTCPFISNRDINNWADGSPESDQRDRRGDDRNTADDKAQKREPQPVLVPMRGHEAGWSAALP